jgi:23S rRNA pseudouridine1911/1915/1917 synthase
MIGERSLLDWLLTKFPDTPKKRAKQWILAGRVKVGGTIVRKANISLPDPGDKLELLGQHAAAVVYQPEFPLHPRLGLLHLDSSLAIVNKGPGLLSVPSPLIELSALTILGDVLRGKLRPRQRFFLPPAFRNLRPLPVHRIDRDTSGLLCMALNAKARAGLIEQFSEHTITREYLAYVEGHPKKPRGVWRHWLRLTRDELRQQVVGEKDAGAVLAVTHYEVVAEFAHAAKLRLRLHTGRKHQIRAQAAHEGLPLIGDPIYRLGRCRIEFPRQALHAELLGLDHPAMPARRISWHAPLAADLRELESSLTRSGRH